MDQSELDEIRKAAEQKLACGHTVEEHAAAAIIVLAAKSFNMPYGVLVRACQMIAEKVHESTGQPEFMAPGGTA